MGGLGRIYFSAIERYAERFNITGSDFDSFLLFVRAIDDEFIKYTCERQKEEAEKNKGKS